MFPSRVNSALRCLLLGAAVLPSPPGAPPVRIVLPAVSLDTWVAAPLGLESLDGKPHRVRLEVVAPEGLRVEPGVAEVEVPAQGRITVPVNLLRAGAPRPSRQVIRVVVRSSGGEVERTAEATAVVEVRPDPALLARLRIPLLVLAVLLLAGAVVIEYRRGRAGR